jgi:hypothetical protein
MIFVVTQDLREQDAAAHNKNITAQAVLAQQTGQYGQIVASARDVEAAIGGGDTTLYLFAHGNNWVVGRFDDMGDLVGLLRDDLRAFEKYRGRRLTHIVVNSCESQTHAAQITGIMRHAIIHPQQAFTVIGTEGRAFSDVNGNIRVAVSSEGADLIDEAIDRNANRDRFQALIEKHCHPAGAGLAMFQC